MMYIVSPYFAISLSFFRSSAVFAEARFSPCPLYLVPYEAIYRPRSFLITYSDYLSWHNHIQIESPKDCDHTPWPTQPSQKTLAGRVLKPNLTFEREDQLFGGARFTMIRVHITIPLNQSIFTRISVQKRQKAKGIDSFNCFSST